MIQQELDLCRLCKTLLEEGIYINPVLLDRKGTVEGEEGCLSFPGLFQKVRRAKSITVQAYNLKLAKTPFAATRTLATPLAPVSPFQADREAVERALWLAGQAG